MKQRIVQMIKRWPALYHLIVRISCLDFFHLREFTISSRLTERWWTSRSINGDGYWYEGFWKGRDHPSKHFLVERIAAFPPIHSILEVGCASGPNLYLLAKRFPQAQIVGIDINPEAVQYGNDQFSQEGISNVKLFVSKADELEQFEDKAFDIVFTSAVLAHIPPHKIKEVIKGIVRVTKQALVLMELHYFEPNIKGPWISTYRRRTWLRDYVALLKQFVPEEQIHVTKITKEIWPDEGEEGWAKNGALIEVTIT